MKKIKLIILSMALQISVNAQNNLVPNYSFESANTANGNVDCTLVGYDDLNEIEGIDSWVNRGGNGAQVGWFDLSVHDCLVGYTNMFDNPNYSDPYDCRYILPSYDKLNSDRIVCIRKRNTKKGVIAVVLKESLNENETYFFRIKLIATKSKISVSSDFNCLLKIRFSDVNDSDGDNNNSWEAVSITRSYPDPNVNPKNCEWEQFETTFTVPSGKTNSKRLFIKAESGTFFIDDVEVYKKCPSTLYLSNRTINSYNINDNYRYTSSDILKAGYDVGGDEVGNFIIKNTNNYDIRSINFKANNTIELLPGFEVDGESISFTAEIEPCTSSNRIGVFTNVEDTNQITTNNNLPIQAILIDSKPIDSESIHVETFSLTPNPANETVKLNLPIYEKANIVFTDMLGKVVIQEQTNNQNTEFNLSRLPKGIYFVKAKTGTQQFVSKLVKE